MNLQPLLEKLSDPRFQDPANGDIFYNYFLYAYRIEDEYEFEEELVKFKDALSRPNNFIDVLSLDIFEEFCNYLDQSSYGDYSSMLKLLYDNERGLDNDDINDLLCDEARSHDFLAYIHQRIIDHVEREGDGLRRPYVFLYGIDRIFPYLRTNAFLTLYEEFNKVGRYKIIVFYPGERVGNSYSLFNLLDDAHFYRASYLINE